MNDENTQNSIPDESAEPAEQQTETTKNPADCPRCAELEASWQRAVADLQNFRRQAEQEKTEFAKFAAEKTILSLLPTLDNLRRANENLPAELQENEWAKGVVAIAGEFEKNLSSLGLSKIETNLGDELDPERHQPIGQAPGAAGKIVAVFENGYELNGKIIRTAKIQIGDGSTD